MAACAQLPGPAGNPRPAYGAELVVRSGENFHSAADVETFVEHAAAAGVATISLLVKQDEDRPTPSGQVYFRSAIAPPVPGYEDFDVLATMLTAAHARNIKVLAWLPQFHDQVAARRHPDWQMTTWRNGKPVPYTGNHQPEFFVNPLHPAVQAYERSIIAEVVGRYAVDGIVLDWIRFDNFDMDLSETSRTLFRAAAGTDPADIDLGTDSPARARWNDFRTDAIAAYVASIRRLLPEGMSLGVYILPPEFAEVGQDAAKFAGHLDTLAPMCYFLDWQFPIDWLWERCLPDTVARAQGAAVVPTLDAKLPDADYQQIFAHLRRDFPAIRRIAWFHHDRWSLQDIQRVGGLGR